MFSLEIYWTADLVTMHTYAKRQVDFFQVILTFDHNEQLSYLGDRQMFYALLFIVFPTHVT